MKLVLAVCILLLGTIVALYPSEVSDLSAVVRDLRLTLKALDSRLHDLEKLVKGSRKKGAATLTGSAADLSPSPRASPQDAASRLSASQDAYLRARTAEASQQYQSAVELYSQTIQLDPANDSAFLHRGLSNLELSRFDEALADLNRSLAIQPNSSRAYASRSKVYEKLKDYTHSIADLEEALLRDPANLEYIVSLAGIEEDQGLLDKAARSYEMAMTILPNSPDLHLKRAKVFRETNQVDQAFAECENAMILSPGRGEPYACRAETYLLRKQLPKAIEDLTEALRRKPDLPGAANMVTAVQQLIELDEAAKKVSAPDRSTAEPSSTAAIASVPAPAAAAPRETKQADPNPAALPALSAPSSDASAPRLAVSDPIPATPSKSPIVIASVTVKQANALTVSARQYTDQGKFQDAIATLDRALELNPSSALAYNSRGYAYLRLRNCTSAVADFSAAIRLKPDYANAYWNRGITRRVCHDEASGRDDMKKAASLGWTTNDNLAKNSRTGK